MLLTCSELSTVAFRILPNLSEMQMVSKEAVPDCSDSD